MLIGATITVERVADAVPGVTVMVGRIVATVLPSIVAEMARAVPALVPVKVAV